MPIRLMSQQDLPQVMKVEESAYDFPCSFSIMENNQKRYYCIVYESELSGEILGHAILSTVAGEASVINIAVAPKAQRQRIGYRLMENMLAYAEGEQCREVFLEVRESNRPAFKMYQQLGFNEVGVRRNYYPTHTGHEDAILLACYL